jgi:hypothetical protein
MNIRINISTIYKQIAYILLSTIIVYIIYQLVIFKKPEANTTDNTEDNAIDTNQKSGDKVKALGLIFCVATFVIVYFKVGVDELQSGGEELLNDVFKFEKSMIDNIRQDVSIGKVPF